ncbi:hypothetical protein KCP71_24470 [Salmonella enterica subsp. enterica]|nr:hypothetical protein KCP71_24470 [Salmonella enterica subsp. enterica]
MHYAKVAHCRAGRAERDCYRGSIEKSWAALYDYRRSFAGDAAGGTAGAAMVATNDKAGYVSGFSGKSD